jgi:hypothetical protein
VNFLPLIGSPNNPLSYGKTQHPLHVSYSRLHCFTWRSGQRSVSPEGNSKHNILFWLVQCTLLAICTSWSLKIKSTGCFETSVRNYHSTLHKIPKERRSPWNRRLVSSSQCCATAVVSHPHLQQKFAHSGLCHTGPLYRAAVTRRTSSRILNLAHLPYLSPASETAKLSPEL